MKTYKEINEAYSDNWLDSESKRIIIEKLKNALKEELNAWYGYIIVKDFLVGSNRPSITKLYEETAKDELEDHAYWLMKRINELDGTIEDITASPASWLTAKHTYESPKWSSKYSKESGILPGDEEEIVIPVFDSLLTNVGNEMGAIETYRELIEIATLSKDWTTANKCKEILADEEEHLQLLQDYLDDMVEKRKEMR
jgi:ferritin-like protein